MEIALGQQYNVGEKPTVILYTYINRRAGTPKNSKSKIVKHSRSVRVLSPLKSFGVCSGNEGMI